MNIISLACNDSLPAHIQIVHILYNYSVVDKQTVSLPADRAVSLFSSLQVSGVTFIGSLFLGWGVSYQIIPASGPTGSQLCTNQQHSKIIRFQLSPEASMLHNLILNTKHAEISYFEPSFGEAWLEQGQIHPQHQDANKWTM